MYCKNCGKQIENRELCKDCESLLNTTVVKDNEKFDVVKEVNNTNNYTNNNQNTNYANNTQNQSEKSKIAAGLFGIFLGGLGIHNFYLGYTGKAVAQLLISVLSCGALSPISGIWGLIEGILILSGDIKDANGNELRD